VRTSRKRLVGHALWISVAAVVAFATVTPGAALEQSSTERLCLVCGELGVVDALLNVILFLPLGVGLAMAGVRPWLALAGMIAGTVSIELLQVTVVGGRDASLGDIIWNSLGGVIGWALGTRADSLIRPGRRTSFLLSAGSLSLWLAICLLVPPALRADPTESEYVGQLGHALGGLPAYPGRVLAATVDDTTVPDSALHHSAALRRSLLESTGARIHVSLVPAAPTPQELSIARIVDEERREIFELSARATDVLFDMRTKAARLRLRPIQFRLPHAFADSPDPAGPDTMSVVARYASDRVVLRGTSRARVAESEIRLTTSSGWRFVSPVSIARDGSMRDALLNAGFLFALVAPVGYWLSCSARFHGRRAFLPLAAGMLAAGLAAGPYLYDIAAPSVADFGGVGAGLAAGFLLAGLLGPRLVTHSSSKP
jgi:hypothetical protein